MHETEQKIILLFRKLGSELSTSQILKHIDESYKELRDDAEACDKETTKEIRRGVAKLHRRILHHLNKLVELDILRITKHGEKGEKYFTLNINEDEELSELSPTLKKRVLISRPALPALPIDGYEQKKLVLRYEPSSWIDKINSAVILGENVHNLDELYKILSLNVSPIVNDSICIENFETFINNENVCDFLKKIDEECEEYGRIVNLAIDISNIKTNPNLDALLSFIEKNNLKNIFFILNIKLEEIQEPSEMLKKYTAVCIKKRMLLKIKNKKLQNAPYFLGKAGHYCISNDDWDSIQELRKNLKCIACSQSAAILDVGRFYNENALDIKSFTQIMFNISKSLLTANSLQRRKSEDYFKTIVQLEKPYHAEFLILARNYVRLWNFGISQPDLDQELVFNMINEAKKKIDDFSRLEEWIYKSCGMTTRFNVALSFAERKICENLSPAKFKSIEITGFEDLYKPAIKKMIIERETIFQLFKGGMDVTFHRKGTMDTTEIFRELSMIMTSYKLPFFSYDFKNIEENINLSRYL